MKRGESYIKSPEWLKNKKATINPQNENDDNCFQYAITVALNHQNTVRDLQGISKNKPFINQYNWKRIEIPTEQKDWKKFEQNNKTIALNILFVPYNTKTIRLAYKSEYNNERENQIILLMIRDNKKQHFLALKCEHIFYGRKQCNRAVISLSRLLRGITSNHHGDFYCLNCLYHLCSTENRLKEHVSKKVKNTIAVLQKCLSGLKTY